MLPFTFAARARSLGAAALLLALLLAGCTAPIEGERIDATVALDDIELQATPVPGLVSGALGDDIVDANLLLTATVRLEGVPWIEVTEWAVTVDDVEPLSTWTLADGARWNAGTVLIDGATVRLAAVTAEPLNATEVTVNASLGWRHVSDTGFDSDRARLQRTLAVDEHPWARLGVSDGEARGVLPSDPGDDARLVVLRDTNKPPVVTPVDVETEAVEDGVRVALPYSPGQTPHAAWVFGDGVTGWIAPSDVDGQA